MNGLIWDWNEDVLIQIFLSVGTIEFDNHRHCSLDLPFGIITTTTEVISPLALHFWWTTKAKITLWCVGRKSEMWNFYRVLLSRSQQSRYHHGSKGVCSYSQWLFNGCSIAVSWCLNGILYPWWTVCINWALVFVWFVWFFSKVCWARWNAA